MDELIKMARAGGNGARWDEHFKTLLLLLLETLGDQDVCAIGYHLRGEGVVNSHRLIWLFSQCSEHCLWS